MVLVAVSLAISGCGSLGDGGPSRNGEGQIVEAGVLDAFDLRVGDCYNGDQVEVSRVMTVPCADGHDFEIFHSFNLDQEVFPAPEELTDLSIKGCLREFELFVGSSFDVSSLNLSWLYPTEQSWAELGDRQVMCSVRPVDELPRQGSARGTGE